MANSNHFQPWRQESSSVNNSTVNYYGKTENTMPMSNIATSSTSSMSMDLYTQIGLQKFASLYKNNRADKSSELDGILDDNDEKNRKMQQFVEATIGDYAKQQILQILESISLLKPPERLFLYLRMPGGNLETDPLRQPQNPLGARSEINYTINWVRSHLEHDPNVSIPKQDVYDDYTAYCARVNIKPLSTADFGKVMKQVFPGVRPRRLGTRGHSRYCYAAMRKATKLDPPMLPDLTNKSLIIESSGTNDEESWRVVKIWAEGLLNTSFDSLKDLAVHIKKHHLNSPAINSSRLLLQKKILQREIKDKKKLNDSGSGIMKKRRKKKRKSSSSSESGITINQTSSAGEISVNSDMTITTSTAVGAATTTMACLSSPLSLEIPESKDEMDVDIKPIIELTATSKQVNEKNAHNQGTNLACDNSLNDGNSRAKTNNYSNSNVNINDNITTVIKQENDKTAMESFEHQNVLCKKVRQAQQAKGLWPQQQQQSQLQIAHSNQFIESEIKPHNFCQPQIPSHIKSERSGSRNGGGIDSYSMGGNKRGTYKDTLGIKKYKTQMTNEQDFDNNDDGDIPSDFILPRERVISICNMDKDALDDYLNGGDNSQEPEAELMQYFSSAEDNGGNTTTASTTPIVGNNTKSVIVNNNNNNNNSNNYNNNYETDLGALQTSIPLLENYQLFSDFKIEKKTDEQINQDQQLMQLRYCLQQNLQNNNNINKNMIPSENSNNNIEATDNSEMNLFPGGSASASLAMMSQRHSSTDLAINYHQNNTNSNSTLRGPKRKISINTSTTITSSGNNGNGVPQSPNTRRRNFSFVPISPGPQSPQIITNNNNNATTNNSLSSSSHHDTSFIESPFVSPRVTPIVKKPLKSIVPMLPVIHDQLSDALIGTRKTAFSRPQQYNRSISEVSSAPPSPSLLSHSFTKYHGMRSHSSSSSKCLSADPIESRSQSVPLHCRSPAFNSTMNFSTGGYNSACSSVAQTPIPPDYTDFNESSILEMLNEPSSGIISNLMDSEVSGMTEILPEYKPNLSMSRSVPSTPLPILSLSGYGNSCNSSSKHNIMSATSRIFDISKSVPTTPIAMNHTSDDLFRYSPNTTNRDFLINGNTIESSGKMMTFYIQNDQRISQHQQQQHHHHHHQHQQQHQSHNEIDHNLSTLTESILPNFDVTDPIIGSELLNNL